jgi:prepilin-type N-terminal cleavage/methylation domain-containing protein
MRRHSAIRQRRGGYTLIELIVVIGIIVLLAGLVLNVIIKFRDMGPRIQTQGEINEMSSAIEQFKSTYQVKYIPPGLVLTQNYNPPVSPNWLAESRSFLSAAWTKGLPGLGLAPANDQVTNTPISVYVLDGNQTLVFLLGGIPPGPDPSRGEVFTQAPVQPPQVAYPRPPYFQGTRTGFRDSPTNPLNAGGPPISIGNAYSSPTGERMKGPFFDFKPDRVLGGQFRDPYGTPFMYLSSKNGNDYFAFGASYAGFIPSFAADGGWAGVSPFGTQVDSSTDRVTRYINPQGFQIISAGKDRMFGPGSWNPSANRHVPYVAGIDFYTPAMPGGDDLANFSTGMLGHD